MFDLEKGEKNFVYIMILIVVSSMLFVIWIDAFFAPPDINLDYIESVLNKTTMEGIDFSRGTNPTSDVTVVEFGDFECPICKDAHAEISNVLKIYSDINYVYKHLPTHSNSVPAAVASECARDQGFFLEYADLLFEGSLNDDRYREVAQILELDMTVFESCRQYGNKSEIIEGDLGEAINLGVRGTPTYIINGKMVEGALTFEKIEEMIQND